MPDRQRLFEAFATDFIGLDRIDPVLTLEGPSAQRRRVYLDTTATALMPRMVWRGLERYLAASSANSHTDAHRGGRDTTRAIEDSRDAIGRLVGYDPARDVVLFTANGATGAVNFLARALFPPELRPVIKRFGDPPRPAILSAFERALGRNGNHTLREIVARPLVVTTYMEHHSNLLPWMEAVGHHHVRAIPLRPDGTLAVEELERVLAAEGNRVRLVAVTAVSNVTGIINPVRQIARLAHRAGAQLLVDGAQWVPHLPVAMHPGDPAEAVDYLVLSGHKLYAPGSRGALVGNLSTLSGRRCVTDLGGGMVEHVSIEDFELKEQVTAREEAGTPNIPGSIAMGLVAEALMTIGMDVVAAEEERRARRLVDRLSAIPGVTIFGNTDLDRVPRAGVVSFDAFDLPHGLVAAYLNDFHNIAVRNGCFCAQPYVKALLGVTDAEEHRHAEHAACGDRRDMPGMVRASLGVYSTEADIDALARALEQLAGDRDRVAPLYEQHLDGTYRLASGHELPQTFQVAEVVAGWAREVGGGAAEISTS